MNIPSTRPFFDEEDLESISGEVIAILKSGQLILGQYTRKFEEAFREYCGVKHAVAVSSCTAALEITLRYFGIEGNEVIVPTNTFIATGNAVIFSGGTPVLADINTDTLCLDPKELLNKMTKKTKGVIIVHLAGLPCPETEEIWKFCQGKGIFMIEDAAHAHGATIHGKKTGSLGNAGCFSFYPTKVMTTGTGGMITTNDDNLTDYAISLRHHGVVKNTRPGKDLNRIVNLGNDWLIDEIRALLGFYQLKNLETNILKRQEIARKYTDALEKFGDISVFKVPVYIRHSYYKFPILLSNEIDKKVLIEKMQSERNVNLGSVYDPPCHLQPIYQQLFGFHQGMFPIAEETLSRTCCLPIYSQMTDEETYYVIESLKIILPNCRRKMIQGIGIE